MKPKQVVMSDSTSLIEAAAELFVNAARSAIAKRGVFYVALAGGSTPKGLYKALATENYAKQIDWSRVHLFFGDERCVLPSHDDSNFKMASNAMIEHIDIPADNVKAMPTHLEPEAVATAYADTMRETLGDQPFDLMLLGLGPDGHIASLFPDTRALAVRDTSTTAVYVEKFDSWRVTMTYPVLNAARQLVVFIAGEAKADIVKAIANNDVAELPVQRLAPTGEYFWYMDAAAANQ